jgi:methanogenic corrinoid protein MtbC1
MPEPLLTRYLQPLIAGRRAECFALIADALAAGQAAEELICDVVWPAMVQVDRLFRGDRINSAAEHMACRINRAVVGQLQPHLAQSPRNQKRVLVTCGVGDQEELGAGMVADLLQADGWEVFHVGGGVPEDEILTMVGQVRPQVLVLFATRPEDVPETRRLVEMIREVGVCPTMNIVVSGGIYNRADGLWQEWAPISSRLRRVSCAPRCAIYSHASRTHRAAQSSRSGGGAARLRARARRSRLAQASSRQAPASDSGTERTRGISPIVKRGSPCASADAGMAPPRTHPGSRLHAPHVPPSQLPPRFCLHVRRVSAIMASPAPKGTLCRVMSSLTVRPQRKLGASSASWRSL